MDQPAAFGGSSPDSRDGGPGRRKRRSFGLISYPRIFDHVWVPRRAFRYRFHPTPQQAGLLNRTFGCVRYVYRRSPWRPTSRGTPLLRRDRALTAFKADLEHAWLQEVSSVPLQ
ncbi:hypothetical protein C3Y87_15630 [Carbonactinospora thermoautotrophica]|nr:hypothetical protein [Carbonactinospora thermoautotrophica]